MTVAVTVELVTAPVAEAVVAEAVADAPAAQLADWGRVTPSLQTNTYQYFPSNDCSIVCQILSFLNEGRFGVTYIAQSWEANLMVAIANDE